MKKLITIILILALLLPAAASAVTCVAGVYTLFIDADTYNREFNAGFDFDSAVFELVIMSDYKTAYYSRQRWTNGVRDTTDVIECSISFGSEMSDPIYLSIPGSLAFEGYMDPDGNGLWLTLGGKSYFRFNKVPVYDISVDYKQY